VRYPEPLGFEIGHLVNVITLRGVHTHNLKCIDVDIPLNRLTVVTGARGAGKRSLVFDTLFAEAQRRYLRETSGAARRALAGFQPDADEIGPLPPAIAIDAATTMPRAEESIASLTRLDDAVDALWSRHAVITCSHCHEPVHTHRSADVTAWLLSQPAGTRCTLAFPAAAPVADEQPAWLASFAESGYFRVQVGDVVYRVGQQEVPAVPSGETAWVLIDRIEVGKTASKRVAESVRIGFQRGEGRLAVSLQKSWRVFDQSPRCQRCDRMCAANDGTLAGRRRAEWDAEPLSMLLHWASEAGLLDLHLQLQAFVQLSLGHLTLGGSAARLCDGECNRVALARALVSGLFQVLYVIDEPTVGLAPNDAPIVADALRSLRDHGNTVVVIAHDRAILAAADHVIDLDDGGIAYQGAPAGLASAHSPTGEFFSGRAHVPTSSAQRSSAKALTLTGENLCVTFPLDVVCAVTGFGGGARQLVEDALYPAWSAMTQNTDATPPSRALAGIEHVADMLLLDRRLPPRRSRTCPATVIKVFDEIRDLFAQTADATARGFGPAHFSFNQPDGRCERCDGRGVLAAEFAGIEAFATACPGCNGARYRHEVLDVLLRNKNLGEVLALSIRDAFRFFDAYAAIAKKLKTLLDVGLDHIRLGQPMESLSISEYQRLALAAYLASHRKPGCVVLWIDPSAGQHPADMADLLSCFNRLLAAGHSVIVVDNDPAVLEYADCVIHCPA